MKFLNIAIIAAAIFGSTTADVSHLSNSYLPPSQPQQYYSPPAPQYLPPAPPQQHYIPPAPIPQYIPPALPQSHYVPPAPQPQYILPAAPQQTYIPPSYHHEFQPTAQYVPPPVQPAAEYLPPHYDAPPAHQLGPDGYHYKTVRKYRFRKI